MEESNGAQPLVIVSDRVFAGVDDEARPLGLLIEDGRIIETFPPEELDEHTPVGAEVVDFGDALVTAGLHDAHQHVFHAALFPSALATEYPGTSEADCVAHMVEFAATRPDDGSWLMSHGWRDYLWDPPVAPTRASLDEAFPTRPVAMYSGDAHTLWVNSAGLAALGIDETTEPPAGGHFVRDAEGRLTGVLEEAAGMIYVAKVVATFPREEMLGIYRDYFAKLSAMGITSVCDMALSVIPGADSINAWAYEELLERGELDVRGHLFPCLGDDQSNLEELQARLTGDMLRAPGFKQFFDGVSSSHTAWCTEDYANARFAGDVGRPTVPAERMRQLVLAAAQRGRAVRIHTIGDRAVHEAVCIFDEARRLYGPPAQGTNTLEHVEDIAPEDIELMARAGVVASVQPPHVTIDITQPDRDLGPERAARMWPFDRFAALGVTMAFGTDAPVVPANSGDVLYTAVTRKTPRGHEPVGGWHPEHDVTMAQALRAYTLGSAQAVGRADELGTLETGKLADLVAWDTDLLSCGEDQIQGARPLATFVGGRCVFEA
ncbi:MAG: amidohydrolase [Atopobiaceae bacterium]|nr:amidohydrolase [Atopobiaceae bacterium]